MTRILITTLALAAAMSVPATAVTPDPIFLTCKFENGRNIEGIVLFKKLHKIRIWYGDGGSQEWDKIDYTRSVITTSIKEGTSVVLSKNLREVIFSDGEENEHTIGACKITPRPKGREFWWWFEPKLNHPFG